MGEIQYEITFAHLVSQFLAEYNEVVEIVPQE